MRHYSAQAGCGISYQAGQVPDTAHAAQSPHTVATLLVLLVVLGGEETWIWRVLTAHMRGVSPRLSSASRSAPSSTSACRLPRFPLCRAIVSLPTSAWQGTRLSAKDARLSAASLAADAGQHGQDPPEGSLLRKTCLCDHVCATTRTASPLSYAARRPHPQHTPANAHHPRQRTPPPQPHKALQAPKVSGCGDSGAGPARQGGTGFVPQHRSP